MDRHCVFGRYRTVREHVGARGLRHADRLGVGREVPQQRVSVIGDGVLVVELGGYQERQVVHDLVLQIESILYGLDIGKDRGRALEFADGCEGVSGYCPAAVDFAP